MLAATIALAWHEHRRKRARETLLLRVSRTLRLEFAIAEYPISDLIGDRLILGYFYGLFSRLCAGHGVLQMRHYSRLKEAYQQIFETTRATEDAMNRSFALNADPTFLLGVLLGSKDFVQAEASGRLPPLVGHWLRHPEERPDRVRSGPAAG